MNLVAPGLRNCGQVALLWHDLPHRWPIFYAVGVGSGGILDRLLISWPQVRSCRVHRQLQLVLDCGCWEKKRIISREASGPLGSVNEP